MLKVLGTSTVIRVAGAASQLALTVLVARVCGKAEAGVFFFAYSIMFIMATLARLGSEISGMRRVAQLIGHAPTRVSDEVASRLLTTGVVALVFAGGVAACGPYLVRHGGHVPDALEAFELLACAIPPFAIGGLLSELLKGAGAPQVGLMYQNVAIPGGTVACVVAIGVVSNGNARIVAAALLGCAVVSVGASYRNLKRRIHGSAARPVGLIRSWSRGTVITIVRDAPALLVVSVTSVVMQWIGSACLGFLAPPTEVAGYSVAIRISIAVSIAQSAAASVVGPQLSVAHAHGDERRLRHVSQETGVAIAAFTWPVLIGMFIWAPECLAIFGSQYSSSAMLLRILIIGQLVAALIGHSGTVLVMCGLYRSGRATALVAAAVLAILSFGLVPLVGALGAAIAMSAAVAAGHVTGLVLARRDLGLWTIPLTRSDLQLLRAGSG